MCREGFFCNKKLNRSVLTTHICIVSSFALLPLLRKRLCVGQERWWPSKKPLIKILPPNWKAAWGDFSTPNVCQFTPSDVAKSSLSDCQRWLILGTHENTLKEQKSCFLSREDCNRFTVEDIPGFLFTVGTQLTSLQIMQVEDYAILSIYSSFQYQEHLVTVDVVGNWLILMRHQDIDSHSFIPPLCSTQIP